jgi:hypothetical protein
MGFKPLEVLAGLFQSIHGIKYSWTCARRSMEMPI